MATPAELAALILDEIVDALAAATETEREAVLRGAAEALFSIAYEDAGGRAALEPVAAARFATSMASAIDHTVPDQNDDDQAQRIADVWAQAAHNAAIRAAAPAGAQLTWNTQRDDQVRELHVPMHGVTVAAGQPFNVGGHRLRYPGEPVGPPEVWIGCRCFLSVAAVTAAVEQEAIPTEIPRGIALVATPRNPKPLAVQGGLPADELHATLGYFGHTDQAAPDLRERLALFLQPIEPFDARVGGVAQMGNDDPQAVTYLLEHPMLEQLRAGIAEIPELDRTHPHFVPHMTIGYGADNLAAHQPPETITFDNVELWWGPERLGNELTAARFGADKFEIQFSERPWSGFAPDDYTPEQWQRACVVVIPGGDSAAMATFMLPIREPSGALNREAVHLAAAQLPVLDVPDEVRSKAKVKLRVAFDQLDEIAPFDITADDDIEAALVAVSEQPWNGRASRFTPEQWRRSCVLHVCDGDEKSCHKLPIREPGGALSRAGVHAATARLNQVDAAPDAKAKAKAKLRGAYSQLGEEPPDVLTADAAELVAWAPSTSPPGTHDAPGWVTNPRETQRLRTYWTKGEGAAKVRWGTPGDLTRCQRHLVKYVGPAFAWGTCQNLHKEALGYWNPQSEGRRGGGDPDEIIDMIDAAFTAAATLEDAMLPPRSLFDDPQLDGPTPMTVRAAGEFTEYFGHLATWDTCHVGITSDCTTPPHSNANYAYFRTGEVDTDEGPVAVGAITAGTGHADTGLDPAATVAHYDDTGTVVADVAVGEDQYGIWAHGIARPGVSAEQRYALRAGAPSGDWRRIGGNLELVGALIVNVPGFPIPRPELAASGERQLALVAAGIVVDVDPNAATIATAVIDAMDRREQDRARRVRAEALQAAVTELRVEALVSAAH